MTLLYTISNDSESQIEEAAEFLSSRWSNVLDEESVQELRDSLSSSSWTAESFEVEDVQVHRHVEVRFRFEVKGLDKKSKPSGDRIHGTALAEIDEYDGVRFSEITVG